RLAIAFELVRCTKAVVRRAAGEQLLRIRLIQMQALGLTIGPAWTAHLRPFVPIETQPSEIVDDRNLRLLRRAPGVGILDAQHEGAARPAREEPVEQRGPRVADVQMTCWARSETDSHD